MATTDSRARALPHVRKVAELFAQTAKSLRKEIERVSDPQGRAMLETAAEVLGGLHTAFQHYQTAAEEAWSGRQTSASGRNSTLPDLEQRGIVQDERGQDQPADRATAQGRTYQRST